MKTKGEKKKSNNMAAMRWPSMLGISVVFHLGIFSMFLFVPEAMPTRQFDHVIYSVNLVEMPVQTGLELRQTKAPTEKKSKTVEKKENEAKRISQPKKEKKPLVIAKRTVETPSVKKPEVSSVEHIDNAISKLEDKVKSEKESKENQDAHLENALASLENRFSDRTGPSIGDMAMQIYMMDLYDRIYSNYAYSSVFQNRKDRKATIVLTVRRDGSILRTFLKKRSGDALFDDLAMSAVKKSNPLPPLPEGYKKSYDKIEIEIIFNPQDSESS